MSWFHRLRLKLANWVLPKTIVARTVFGSQCVSESLRWSGTDYMEWHAAGGRIYAASDLTKECQCESARPQFRCNICTAEFDADPAWPTVPCECPSCNSRDVVVLRAE